MVEETIKAIRETEAAADVIVKEAEEKSWKIMEDAKQEAERMIKSQEETHRIFAQDAMQDAREKARVFQEETGARALRAIIEEFMLDIMYEIPKDENIGEVTITRSYIEGTGGPLISLRGQEVPRLP